MLIPQSAAISPANDVSERPTLELLFRLKDKENRSEVLNELASDWPEPHYSRLLTSAAQKIAKWHNCRVQPEDLVDLLFVYLCKQGLPDQITSPKAAYGFVVKKMGVLLIDLYRREKRFKAAHVIESTLSANSQNAYSNTSYDQKVDHNMEISEASEIITRYLADEPFGKEVAAHFLGHKSIEELAKLFGQTKAKTTAHIASTAKKLQKRLHVDGHIKLPS